MSQSSLHVALVVVAIVVALGGAWVMHRRASSNVVVLGQELADASAVEKERLARGPGPSPLANKSYDQATEGHSLFRVNRTELDDTIRGFLANFAAGSSQTRTQLTSLLSMDDLYTLLHFSKRSAVFALRERSPERCSEGMTALAAVDIRRLDPRDLDWAAALVDSVATLIAADRDKLYNAAAALAEPPTRSALTSFHTRNPKGASLTDWGYRTADTPSGPSLVETESDPYSPTIDLLGLAVRVSEVVRPARYPRSEFTVATSIPPVWIGSTDVRVRNVLGASTGTVLMRLSAATHEGIGRQLFNVYFSELATEDDAAWLAAAAPKEELGKNATVAFSAGRLVCIAVAASTMVGTPSVETSSSLRIALEPVRTLLSNDARK